MAHGSVAIGQIIAPRDDGADVVIHPPVASTVITDDSARIVAEVLPYLQPMTYKPTPEIGNKTQHQVLDDGQLLKHSRHEQRSPGWCSFGSMAI